VLVIKGDTGRGKTILALELLKYFNEDRNIIYISTRVVSKDLLLQYPWISPFLQDEEELETSSSETKSPKKGMIFDLTLSDLPDFIRRIISEAKRVEHPFMVIDSWDAIVTKAELNPGREAEERLINTIKEMNGTAIFIREGTETTPLDFLADGVITLSSFEAANPESREMKIEKLRGSTVDTASVNFSLSNGRFSKIR
jgi:KaiC/GvpD/RAD55 family RecA-like ATPase